jgi:hypothetical protein
VGANRCPIVVRGNLRDGPDLAGPMTRRSTICNWASACRQQLSAKRTDLYEKGRSSLPAGQLRAAVVNQ